MATREVYGNDYNLDRWIPLRHLLREVEGSVWSVGWRSTGPYDEPCIIIDSRSVDPEPDCTEGILEYSDYGGTVIVLSYKNLEEWREEVRHMVRRLDRIPATRKLGDWKDTGDGGAGKFVPVGGPPPARGPVLERTRDEALELPRNP